MSKIPLAAVVKYCDDLLQTNAIGDYDGALNGLQAGNSGTITHIAATVDASLATVKLAIAASGGFADRPSRFVLEFPPAVDGEKS